jgi:hypothetical protein
MAETDTRVRLLICAVCKSIEELPAYDGPQEHDDTGNYRLSFHQLPSGNFHPYTVADISKADWDKPAYREAIVRQITQELDGTVEAGLGQAFYDVRSNFQEDAITCWKEHGRPGSQHKTGCEDYKSDRKRLLPDTRADRRAEGLDPKNRPSTYLCQFCPYHRVVETRVRTDRGDYSKKPWEGN